MGPFVILILAGVGSVIIGVGILFYFDNQIEVAEEHYESKISGLKENYLVNEPIEYSVTVEGFGHFCGDYDMSIHNETTKISTNSIRMDCVLDVKLENFVYTINFQQNTDYKPFTVSKPGNYTLKAEFERYVAKPPIKVRDEIPFTVIEKK